MNTLNDIKFDQITGFQRTVRNTVTNHKVEDGTSVNDNTILQPTTIRATFVVSDVVPLHNDHSLNTGRSYSGTRRDFAYSLLRELRENKTICTLICDKGYFDNLRIVSINDSLSRREEFSVLYASIEFIQIETTRLETVEFRNTRLKKDKVTNIIGAEMEEKGVKQVKDESKVKHTSILEKILG
jgi:hypothetical protein